MWENIVLAMNRKSQLDYILNFHQNQIEGMFQARSQVVMEDK